MEMPSFSESSPFEMIKKIKVPHCARGPASCEKCEEINKKPAKYSLVKVASDPNVCRPMTYFGTGKTSVLMPYEVVKVFSSEKEAKEYAKKNKIEIQ
ncbi:MAG: hypothetical protein ABII22_00925 [Candidatus Micrarchaeota archaeon]